jgi:chemotaxis protein MotA
MNIATIIGFVLAFGGIISGYLLEGGSLGALLLLSPALIVFGGTFGAACISFNTLQVKKMPSMLVEAFKSAGKIELVSAAEHLVNMATLSRSKGILALEEYLTQNPTVDPVLKSGATLLLDGVSEEILIESMSAEIEIIEKAKHADISLWESMAGFAPTMGVLGTVMGLVQTLSDMGEPEELTHSISSAFIATLYGVGIANILFMPIASKLKLNLKFTIMRYEMLIRGLVDIQRGRTPKAINEMTLPYLAALDNKAVKSGGKK